MMKKKEKMANNNKKTFMKKKEKMGNKSNRENNEMPHY